MPDLLASTSLFQVTPAIPPRVTVAAPVAADFIAMLGDLVLPASGKPQDGKGQGIADDGKILPVEGELAGDETDDADPLVAWLPAGLVPLPAVGTRPLPDVAAVPVAAALPPGIETGPVSSPLAHAGQSVAAPASTALPAPVAGGTGVAPVVGAATLQPADAAPAAAAPAPLSAGTPASAGFEPVKTSVAAAVTAGGGPGLRQMQAAAPEIASGGRAEAPTREPPVREPLLRSTPVHAAAPQLVAPGAMSGSTAAQVFAAAISASFDSPTAPAPRTAEAGIVQAQATAAEQLRTTVLAMSGVEQPPLDLSREDWAGKMVDRIAALQDAAEAADTRIRLAPENLGNVDVSIRREGDRVHVHFAAENPAARQLLAEAAPRLAELAEARGVKLGQTSVDAGTGGQPGSRDQPETAQPARPASAAARVSETDHDDDRIA